MNNQNGKAEQLARRSLKALYIEVAEPIAKNVEGIVLAAFEEIRNVRLNETKEVKTKEEIEKMAEEYAKNHPVTQDEFYQGTGSTMLKKFRVDDIKEHFISGFTSCQNL